jgi:hypothetical protein
MNKLSVSVEREVLFQWPYIPLKVPILSHFIPVSNLQPDFFKIHINISILIILKIPNFEILGLSYYLIIYPSSSYHPSNAL